MEKIPVILDTDISSDIDDTWALAMMLNSPELDIKLIVTTSGNTANKAQIVAKFLDIMGCTDIPVGIGIKALDAIEKQGRWAEDYDLDTYPGVVYQDGVSAMVDKIMASDEQVTLISIGPVTNIAKALEQEPKIIEKAMFVGMQGWIYTGYSGFNSRSAEWNVWCDIKACQKVFKAPWDITITPLDTCAKVQLKGDKYQKVRNTKTPIIETLMKNYDIFAGGECTLSSTILYDTAAIYLALSEELFNMEDLNIKVNDSGYTVIDKAGKKIRCATSWKDLAAYEDFLVERLCRTADAFDDNTDANG